MSPQLSLTALRSLLASAIVAVGVAIVTPRAASAEDTSIRPFVAHVDDDAIADMRLRLTQTRWPEMETVGDASQGARLADLKGLVAYWASDYDWRTAEAKLNAYPQFMTTIDGVDIHFIHVRSENPDALPVIISHGWPGSVFEQIKLIEPLTNPVAFGGKAEDSFDVVIPSLPGFGFSGKPAEAGWDLDRTAKAWGVLMNRLGYDAYVAQGGDWGAGIVQAMGRQAPDGLIGIHTNLPAAIPDEAFPALGGGPLPEGATEEEKASIASLGKFLMEGNLTYVGMIGVRPQAISYAHADSPAGLAGWMLVHPGFANWSYGTDPDQSPTVDDVLDNFSLYWLTNTAASSARIYWENRKRSLTSASAQMTSEITIPVAVTAFPDEVYTPTESWSRKAFSNLIYYNKGEAGGHFAAWEYPEIFAQEMRAAFASLRTQ